MRAISSKSTAINVHTWPAKMTGAKLLRRKCRCEHNLGAPVYDVSASTFGKSPQKFSLESAAADLFRLAKLVRRKTGAPRIFLVPTRWAGSSSDAWCSESFPTTRTPAGTLAPGPTSSSGFHLRHPTRRHRVRGRWWLAGDAPRPHRGSRAPTSSIRNGQFRRRLPESASLSVRRPAGPGRTSRSRRTRSRG